MNKIRPIVRLIVGILLGIIVTLIAFGIVLSLFWTLSKESQSLKLMGAAISTLLSFFIGGVVVGWWGKRGELTLPVALGFLMGGFSFIYIFGIDLIAFALTILSSISAGAGGFLVRRMGRGGRSAEDFNAG